MKNVAGLVLVVAAAACGETERPQIVEPPVSIQLTADVNVQLGDTPVGQQPSYVITGQARATRGGVEVDASIDSVVVFYRRGAQPDWIRLLRRTTVPFSDRLPFTVQSGDTYQLRAELYAHAWHQNASVSGSDEWIAFGKAYAP